MQILADSLSTAVFGIAVVFTVLIGLIILIKLMNIGVSAMAKRKKEPEIESVLAVEVPAATQPTATAALSYAPHSLKLTDVDERTAAIIMAIICDETGVPANELYFKSMRLLGDQVPAQNKGV